MLGLGNVIPCSDLPVGTERLSAFEDYLRKLIRGAEDVDALFGVVDTSNQKREGLLDKYALDVRALARVRYTCEDASSHEYFFDCRRSVRTVSSTRHCIWRHCYSTSAMIRRRPLVKSPFCCLALAFLTCRRSVRSARGDDPQAKDRREFSCTRDFVGEAVRLHA